VKKLVHHCLHQGVLVLNAGTYDNIIRLLMPLTITDEEFNQALQVIEGGLSAVAVELGELTAVE
jgi:4-aminobutyrate aminotransferase / (S)-3-amino-2-methylpropionate transaminase / 5-aminovalerate transaminase